MSITRRVVEDVETLRAISHPLRLRLLGLLRSEGPATASELARVVGESSGSTSYHLRRLEHYGFIVDAAEQRSGRERRWRSVHDMTTFPDHLAELPGGREALDQVNERQLQVLADGVAAWRDAGSSEGFGHDDYIVDLDPEDLQELTAEISTVIDRYRSRTGSRAVTLHVLALPRTP